MSPPTTEGRVRVVVIVVAVVLVLGGLFAAGVVATRRGPGAVMHIHNGGKAPLAGVRVTSGDWSFDVPAVAAGDSFDVHVPRGNGPTWMIDAPGCSGSSGWDLFQPFGGEVHAVIEDSSISFGDEEAVDLLGAHLRETLTKQGQGPAPR